MNSINVAESKAALQSFRVAELQSLLSAFGRSKVGRKQELLLRTLDLYKDPKLASRMHAKVKELERSRHSHHRSHPYATHGPPISSSPFYPVNPDVKLAALPFHEKWMTLVRPTTLNCSGRVLHYGASRPDETTVKFNLAADVTETIKASRIKQTFDSKTPYKMQIILRLCPLELSCSQHDQYPPNCHVSVNGSHLHLPGYQPARTPAEHRKYGQPVDITTLCHLSPNVVNCVTVQAAHALNGQRFVVAIQICRNRTALDLLHAVQSSIRNADHSRALIKQKLASDPDSEIATTSLRISLLCPLGKMRMLHPGRATTCNHLQCFDIATFLQMNERKARWICPVCDGVAAYECLFIDGLMMEILSRAPQSVDHIELLERRVVEASAAGKDSCAANTPCPHIRIGRKHATIVTCAWPIVGSDAISAIVSSCTQKGCDRFDRRQRRRRERAADTARSVPHSSSGPRCRHLQDSILCRCEACLLFRSGVQCLRLLPAVRRPVRPFRCFSTPESTHRHHLSTLPRRGTSPRCRSAS